MERVGDRELHDVAVPQPGLVEAQRVADHRRAPRISVGAGPGRSEIHASILPGLRDTPASQLDAKRVTSSVLPGIYNSGPTLADAVGIGSILRPVETADWDELGAPEWIAALETAVASGPSPRFWWRTACPCLLGPDVGRGVGHACRGGVPGQRPWTPPPRPDWATDDGSGRAPLGRLRFRR